MPRYRFVAIGSDRNTRAFTLVELLVVVSIIALLISILLPSLRQAREQAKAVVCASSTKHMATAVSSYLYDSQGIYPPSYVYPNNELGEWDPEDQDTNHPYGYTQWSWALYDQGDAPAKAFQCPKFTNGGAPRTNPGPIHEDWETGQVDQNGDSTPVELTDKQAPRLAYAPNAAIMPRNKFTKFLSGGARTNVLVNDTAVRNTGNTILLAEFMNNWKALSIEQGNGLLCKSHRPINPFYHLGSGYNEYDPPKQTPGFVYGTKMRPESEQDYGLLPLSNVKNKTNVLDYTSGVPQINAVGRHHPGGDKYWGGTANFLFCDGHGERMTPFQSVARRKWGERYYSLSGNNEILNPVGSEGG